jgi:hypothetical protein
MPQQSEGANMWLSILGWTATAFFASGIQAAAAVLWIVYGIEIHSAPGVVSNLMVGVAAVYTSLRLARNKKSPTAGLAGSVS